MRNLRIWFSKTDRAKYVSHLDLNRCMLRAFRRSGIPIWYTEGFNPHPYMTFALPLPLGAESVNDIMDIRIDGEMPDGEIVSRLNAALPEGLSVIRAAEPWGKVSEIEYASYELYFEASDEAFAEIKRILSMDEIVCERMGKQGGRKIMKQFNLIDFVKEYSLETREGRLVLNIILAAGNSTNVNPILLSDALARESGGLLEVFNIRRTGLLTANGAVFS